MTIPAEHVHRRLFHFTHVDNLPGLLRSGFLANNHPQFPRTDHRSVAAASIQDRRANMVVPCGPGGVVHDYVPLYFGSISPMLLGVVNAQNVDQFDMLYFEFPISLIDRADVVFTNASANTTQPPSFFSDPRDLNQLDWAAIDDRKWGGAGAYKNRRMAEALVKTQLPLSAATCCVVWNENIANDVRNIAAQAGTAMPAVTTEDPQRRHFFTGFASGSQASLIAGPKEIALRFEDAVQEILASGTPPQNARFPTLQAMLNGLRENFGSLPHTAELVGLKSANGMHKHTVDRHTQDVVAKLRALPGFQTLDPKRQDLVELAAYLHDIGKGPKSRWAKFGGTQQVDNNHPVGAMPMMVEILTHHVASAKPKTVRRLLKLICYHDLVGDIIGRDRDERQLVDVAENRLDLDMLILIGHADASSLQERWEWNFVQKAAALRNRCAPLLASDS